LKVSEVLTFIDQAIVNYPESEGILTCVKYRLEFCMEEEKYPCGGSYLIEDCVPDNCMNGVCSRKLFYLQTRVELAKHIHEVSGVCL
jgi:hypothetical protein